VYVCYWFCYVEDSEGLWEYTDFPRGKRINRCNLSVLKLSKAYLNSVWSDLILKSSPCRAERLRTYTSCKAFKSLKTYFLAFPENLLAGSSRKHSSMTINTDVGGQASSTQKYRCGCVMHHDKGKVHKDWIRIRQQYVCYYDRAIWNKW